MRGKPSQSIMEKFLFTVENYKVLINKYCHFKGLEQLFSIYSKIANMFVCMIFII
jgi:hypothetical protein